MNLPASHTVWATALLIALLLLLSSASSPSRALLFEQKTRLGSTPPTCHNRCSRCHPCMAVQVPSMPRNKAYRRPADQVTAVPAGFIDSSGQGNRFAFYKPMGWKCRCGNHFFNP